MMAGRQARPTTAPAGRRSLTRSLSDSMMLPSTIPRPSMLTFSETIKPVTKAGAAFPALRPDSHGGRRRSSSSSSSDQGVAVVGVRPATAVPRRRSKSEQTGVSITALRRRSSSSSSLGTAAPVGRESASSLRRPSTAVPTRTLHRRASFSGPIGIGGDRRSSASSPGPGDWSPTITEAPPRRPSTALPKDRKSFREHFERTAPDVVAKAKAAHAQRVSVGTKQHERERRREADEKYAEWCVKADERVKERKAAEARAKEELQRSLDTKFVQMAEEADAAYEKWFETKDKEKIARESDVNEDELREHLRGQPFTVSEVEVAVSRLVEDDVVFAYVQELLKAVAQTVRGGRLTADAIADVVAEAEIDAELDAALQRKAEEEERRAASVDGKAGKAPKEEAAALKVGRAVLEAFKAAGKGRDLNAVMSTLRPCFGATGQLPRQGFKDTLGKLGVAVNPAQLADLYAAVDPKGADAVTRTALTRLLLAAAVTDMDASRRRPAKPPVAAAKRVLLDMPRAELDTLVADVFEQADEDRLDRALGRADGVIELWQFRRGLRGIDTTSFLTASMRNDVNRALERSFAAIDKDGKGFITWVGFEFFLRNTLLHGVHESQRVEQIRRQGWDEMTLIRLGKWIVKSIEERGTLFGKQTTDVDSMFHAMDIDGGGTIDKNELRMSMRRLGCGLTLYQEENLLTIMDINGDGEIDLGEFRNFMAKVNARLRIEAEAKRRLQTEGVALMDELVKACGWQFETLQQLCGELRAAFEPALDDEGFESPAVALEGGVASP